jgi:hypothetical protein
MLRRFICKQNQFFSRQSSPFVSVGFNPINVNVIQKRKSQQSYYHPHQSTNQFTKYSMNYSSNLISSSLNLSSLPFFYSKRTFFSTNFVANTKTTTFASPANTTATTSTKESLTRLSLCLPRESFDDIIHGGGIQLTVDGMEYRLDAKPIGTTKDVIEEYQNNIKQLQNKLLPLQNIKNDIDFQAANFTKKVVVGALGYLIAQGVVVFKLTFASRLGWDVMEPITYLVTFSTGIFGLGYFSIARKDYLYETVWDQVCEKRKSHLYSLHKFDIAEYNDLVGELERKELKLARLIV